MSLRRILVLASLLAASCERASSPPENRPEPPPPPAPASAIAVTPPAPEEEVLGFTVRSPNRTAVPVYESMDEGAPIAFEADDGSGGIVLGSAQFEKGGQQFTYLHVDTESGRGWIWEKHVSVRARPKVVPTQPSEPERRRSGRAERPGIVPDGSAVPRERAEAEPAPVDAPAPRNADVPDVLTINAGGAEVNVAEHLVPGQYTIVDFYSEHCGPCRQVAPQLVTLAQHPSIVLRKVDIDRPGSRGIDWQSPVAKQHGLRSIPRIQLYGPTGALEAENNVALQRLTQIARGG